MEKIFNLGDYTVKNLTKDRLCVVYANEEDSYMVCKYNKTEEDVKIMIADFIDWLIADKITKRKNEKEIAEKMLEAIKPFMPKKKK